MESAKASIIAAVLVIVAASVLPGVNAAGSRSLTQSCTTALTDLVTACPGVQAEATQFGKELDTASDARIQQVVASNPKISDACCSKSVPFYKDGCSCDSSVLSLTKSFGITAKGFATIYKAGQLACGKDKIPDGTYSSKCSAVAALTG